MARRKFWGTVKEIDPCVTSMDGNSHYSGGGIGQKYRFWFKWGDPFVIDGVESPGPCP